VRTRLQLAADRTAAAARRTAGENLRHLREDAGLSKSAVAAIAGIDRTYMTEVEDGDPGVSLEVLERVAAAVGADLSLRVFPNTGPPIRDRFQAPMIEALLRAISPAWDRHLEVGVHRPVRGVIDLVLAIAGLGRIVTVEAHSELRRLEQQLRWAAEKSEALPSAALWPALTRTGVVVAVPARVLLLRSTSTTRRLATEFATTLAAAYPASPGEVLAALADPTRSWPGNGLLWARVEGPQATILSGVPRGVRGIAR
jgi:transcriptional regulator with XRE-family HTH domain